MVNTRYDVSLFRKIVTGCWSPQTCSAFNVHAVMWRWTLRFGHKCCINLCQSFSESVCVFCLVIYFSCCVFWDIWGLGDPKLKVKKQNTKSATAWQGLIEHVCKQSRSIFQKRCGHLDFLCGKHLYFAWLPCDYIVSAWDQLWALNMTYCCPTSYAAGSSSICVFFSTGMPWSTCNRLVQKKMKNMLFSNGRRNIIEVQENI